MQIIINSSRELNILIILIKILITFNNNYNKSNNKIMIFNNSNSKIRIRFNKIYSKINSINKIHFLIIHLHKKKINNQ